MLICCARKCASRCTRPQHAARTHAARLGKFTTTAASLAPPRAANYTPPSLLQWPCVAAVWRAPMGSKTDSRSGRVVGGARVRAHRTVGSGDTWQWLTRAPQPSTTTTMTMTTPATATAAAGVKRARQASVGKLTATGSSNLGDATEPLVLAVNATESRRQRQRRRRRWWRRPRHRWIKSLDLWMEDSHTDLPVRQFASCAASCASELAATVSDFYQKTEAAPLVYRVCR